MADLTPEQSARLKQILTVAGPTYYGAGSGLGAVKEQLAAKPLPSVNQGQNAFQKVVDVGKQVLNVGETVAKKAGSFAVNTPKYIYRDVQPFLQGVASTATGELQKDQANVKTRMDQLDEIQTQITNDYKAGRITKENYARRITDIGNDYASLSKDSQSIATKADRGNVAEGAVWLAADLAMGGKLELGSATQTTAVQTFKAGGRSAIQSLIDLSATKFERAIMNVPSARALMERNLETLAKRGIKQAAGENFAQFVARESKTLAMGMLIKRPLFYEQNIGGAKDIYNKILEGNGSGALKSAAWLGSQMIEGGPIGGFAKGYSWLKGNLSDLAHGTGSYIDEVSKLIGDGNSQQIAKHILDTPESERAFRILQATNMHVTGNDARQAAENTLQTYIQSRQDLASLTPQKLVEDINKWADAEAIRLQAIKSGLIKGINPEDVTKYAVVRWDTPTKAGLRNELGSYVYEKLVGKLPDNGFHLNNWAGGRTIQLDPMLREDLIKKLNEIADRPGVGFGNNENLMARLENIIATSSTLDDLAKGINHIETASVQLENMPKKLAAQMSELGYTIAAPFGGNRIPELDYTDIQNTTRKLISAAQTGDTALFDAAKAPQVEVAQLARALEKAGLSPEAAGAGANQKLAESLVASLDKLQVGTQLGLKNSQGSDMVGGGRAILSQLQGYLENKLGIFGVTKNAATDIRQLTPGEVSQALGLTKNAPLHGVPEEAKQISKAIMQAYLDVPLEYRGLGDRVVDGLYRYNPLQKYYSRLQSAFRYTYNPFFRTQERVESAVLSHAQADNLLWTKASGGLRSRGELNEGAKILDNSGILTSSLPGEAANDLVLGRITANVTQGQKRSLAGLAYDIADRRGMTLQQLVNEHPDDVTDALRVVVQYPTRGVLASPLARTMNLMFFPVRYNAKVTQIAAQVLGRQPPAVQLAVLHSGFRMRDWLKSDEGIRWQAEHQDAIQVLNWLTPINSVESTLNMLSHKPNSIGEIGQLGGLPLGFITQILDSEGVIKINRPYVMPKTGDLIPDYIPQSTRAKASVALTDLLGSMFTYPGRTLGLPGKDASIKKFVRNFIATNGSDFDKQYRTEDLTPLQQNWIRVLKGDTSREAIDSLYGSPAPGQFSWYTIPPLNLPQRVNIPQPVAVPTKTETAAAKAGQRTSRTKNIALPIPPR